MVKKFCFVFFFCFLGETANERRMEARGETSDVEGSQPLEVSET